MVVLAASVDGRLDFSLAALWGRRETSVSARSIFPMSQQHVYLSLRQKLLSVSS